MSRTRSSLSRTPKIGVALLLSAGLVLPSAGLASAASVADDDAVSTASSSTTQAGAELIRISGADRYASARAVSYRWSPGVATVFVSSGETFADTTVAAASAGRAQAPVLLTKKDRLPAVTVDALQRLQPGRIVVVGNDSAVSGSVVDELRGLTSGSVERVAGANAYATAAAVAADYPQNVKRVYLASGDAFPDALTGSAAAGFHGVPILYARAGELPMATAAALKRLQPQEVVILGGTAAISESVARAAAGQAGLSTWRRLGGVDRFATAAAVERELPDRGAVFAATGSDFADANVGAALAAMRGAPIVLVRPDSVPTATMEILSRRAPQWVTVLGGTVAVSDSTAQSLVTDWVNTPVTPPPGDIAGWSLQYSTDFSTLNGWTVRDETQSNDNSRNIAKNVVPSASGLSIHARRESGYNRPYTSGEIHGSGTSLKVPNYFRAEVVAEVMDEDGLWPAALWFRPVGHSDGEIDVMEYMGGRIENQKRKRFAVTMHNEYGSTQAPLKEPIYIDELSRSSVTGIHKYTIEKTPGQIKVWVDDDVAHASVFKASDAAWWNRIMEVEGREWYPRITLQVGSGSRVQVVPEPSSSWNHSEMKVHSLKLWSKD